MAGLSVEDEILSLFDKTYGSASETIDFVAQANESAATDSNVVVESYTTNDELLSLPVVETIL